MVARRRMPDIHDVPCPKHPRTRVIRKGVRTRSGKTYQRFQCQSVSGKHTFLAEIPASGGQQEQEQQQAEKQKHKEQLAEVSCAEHPGSKVTRRGFIIYPPPPKKTSPAVTTPHEVRTRRPRYLCTPDASVGAPHKFVPGLSETEWNAPGTPAGSGATPVMTGKAAARGYKYPLDVIAQALWDLSAGGSYVRTSIAARVAIGLPEPDPKMRRNAGRLTADWCEVFAPVLWEQYESERIAQAEAAHASGFLRALLLDDDPVYRGGARKARSTQLYSFLAAAEVFLDPAGTRAETRLRLVRAYPNHTADAYRLLLGEVGYVPDLLVTDAAPAVFTLVNELRSEGHPNLPDSGWTQDRNGPCTTSRRFSSSWTATADGLTRQARRQPSARPVLGEPACPARGDVETTGLDAGDRIISVGFVKVLRGKTLDTWSSLVNPRGKFISRGAEEVHGLVDSDLTDAPTFDSLRDSIGRWLQPDVIFVGHNLGFDFSMLRREFEASGSPLTTLTGLDTMTLAAAAGIAAGRISLSELLERLGLANSAEHTAVGDALATAQAVIALLGLLVDQGRTSIDDLTFTTDSVLVRELSEQEVRELLPDTPEHHASHSQPMMLPEQRQEALDYCLSVGCTILQRRMQDALAGPEDARWVVAWAIASAKAWSGPARRWKWHGTGAAAT